MTRAYRPPATKEDTDRAIQGAFRTFQRVYREEQRPALQNILRCKREAEERENIDRLSPADACRVIRREWRKTFRPRPSNGLPVKFSDEDFTGSARMLGQRGVMIRMRGAEPIHKGVG